MVNTGPAGLALIIYFTLNGAFVGTRLGLCWLLVEERYVIIIIIIIIILIIIIIIILNIRFPEFKTTKCRDPYPTIAEKAG